MTDLLHVHVPSLAVDVALQAVAEHGDQLVHQLPLVRILVLLVAQLLQLRLRLLLLPQELAADVWHLGPDVVSQLLVEHLLQQAKEEGDKEAGRQGVKESI